MLPKTRAVLDTIDEALSIRDQAARELWDVLSALRGPDVDVESQVKCITTIPIRRAAFPKTRANVLFGGIYLPATFSGADVVPRSILPMGGHFCYHVLDAAEVLGILSDGE